MAPHLVWERAPRHGHRHLRDLPVVAAGAVSVPEIRPVNRDPPGPPQPQHTTQQPCHSGGVPLRLAERDGPHPAALRVLPSAAECC